MLSLGIDASLAFWMASASDGLPSGSPPPSFAATVMARASLVNSLPRRASTIAFLCLIPAHLECPAMGLSLEGGHAGGVLRERVRHAGHRSSNTRGGSRHGPGRRERAGARVVGAPLRGRGDQDRD